MGHLGSQDHPGADPQSEPSLPLPSLGAPPSPPPPRPEALTGGFGGEAWSLTVSLDSRLPPSPWFPHPNSSWTKQAQPASACPVLDVRQCRCGAQPARLPRGHCAVTRALTCRPALCPVVWGQGRPSSWRPDKTTARSRGSWASGMLSGVGWERGLHTWGLWVQGSVAPDPHFLASSSRYVCEELAGTLQVWGPRLPLWPLQLPCQRHSPQSQRPPFLCGVVSDPPPLPCPGTHEAGSTDWPDLDRFPRSRPCVWRLAERRAIRAHPCGSNCSASFLLTAEWAPFCCEAGPGSVRAPVCGGPCVCCPRPLATAALPPGRLCARLHAHVPLPPHCVCVQEWTYWVTWFSCLRCCHLLPTVAAADTPTVLDEGSLLRVPTDTCGPLRSCPQGTPAGTHLKSCLGAQAPGPPTQVHLLLSAPAVRAPPCAGPHT